MAFRRLSREGGEEFMEKALEGCLIPLNIWRRLPTGFRCLPPEPKPRQPFSEKRNSGKFHASKLTLKWRRPVHVHRRWTYSRYNGATHLSEGENVALPRHIARLVPIMKYIEIINLIFILTLFYSIHLPICIKFIHMIRMIV